MVAMKKFNNIERELIEQKLGSMGKQIDRFNIIVPFSSCLREGDVFTIPKDFRAYEVPIFGTDKTAIKVVSEEGYEINPKWFISVAVDTEGRGFVSSGTAVEAILNTRSIDLYTAFKAVVGRKIVCACKQTIKTKNGFKTIWKFDFC